MPWIYVGEEWPFAEVSPEVPFPAFRTELAIRQAEDRWSRRATTHSRALIHNTMAAVIEDPSPAWRDGNRRFQVYSELVERGDGSALDDLFRGNDETLLMRRRKARPLTYFEALHWVGQNLDRLCPFKK